MRYCVRARGGGKTTELARRVLNAALDGETVLFVAMSQTEANRVERMLAPWGITGRTVSINRRPIHPLSAYDASLAVFDNYDLMRTEFADEQIYFLKSRGADVIVSVTGEGTI